MTSARFTVTPVLVPSRLVRVQRAGDFWAFNMILWSSQLHGDKQENR